MTAPKIPSAPPSSRAGVFADTDVREVIRRRSASFHARTRVAEVIRALAMDICGDDDSLSAADRAWLRQALIQPVAEATEEALGVLFDELGSTLRSAPTRLRSGALAPIVSRRDFE